MDALTYLRERMSVEDAVIGMFVATDERDWRALEACFTDPFVLDMTSLVGGEPVRITPQQVASAWAEGFKPLDHVHHQVGNLQTTFHEKGARVRCYGVAFHHREHVAAGLKTRIFVGTYELDLVRSSQQWLISNLSFKLKFVDGNLELETG